MDDQLEFTLIFFFPSYTLSFQKTYQYQKEDLAMKQKFIFPAILLFLILLSAKSGERSNRSPILMPLSA